MNELRFDFDWEEPQGARGPELAATWARLTILVNGQPVTRVLDHDSRTVRDYVYTPLLPLAEWMVANWWALRYEVQRHESFSSRHNLRFAGEGFALPNLEFFPDGRQTVLQWLPRAAADWKVRFLDSGSAVLNDSAVDSAARTLIEAVVSRLHDLGFASPILATEWQQTRDITGDEANFCRAAAALGIDPLDASPLQEEMILDAHEALAGQEILEEEFFFAADPERLAEQVGTLVQSGRALAAKANSWRLDPLSVDLNCLPWQQGYRLAAELRDRLGLASQPFADFNSLIDSLAPNSYGPPIVYVADGSLFDALAYDEPAGGTAFALAERKIRDSAKSFALCRAVCEVLVNGSEGSPGTRMVTASQTARQKRNRAFAAEFLAPAALLSDRLTSSTIGTDEVEALADEFSVSTLVIQHQLENHKLVDRIVG